MERIEGLKYVGRLNDGRRVSQVAGAAGAAARRRARPSAGGRCVSCATIDVITLFL